MGEGGSLGSVAELELGEHVADVGGHGLGADVQAGRDLGVGQALPPVPAIGLTSLDQRQPGWKRARPIMVSAIVTISTAPSGNERVPSA
jgi:hypothetical protein